MPTDHTPFEVTFHSEALSRGDLFLRRVHGVEEISRLFEFDLELQTDAHAVLDLAAMDAMLEAKTTIAFGADDAHPRHGVLRELTLVSPGDAGPTVYRAAFVPRLWYATQNVGSYVFQDLSVPEIVKDVLTEIGFADGDDFEFRLTNAYPKREYTVQYQESDFDFICRLLEHEGIFFFFTHEGVDKVVFADGNNAFHPIEGLDSIPFDARLGTVDAAESVVALSRTARAVQQKVILKDYNYRTPSTQLRAEAPVLAQGHGYQLWYGDHFKDGKQGQRYARVRAQELAQQRHVYTGHSRVRGLTGGTRFTLEGHTLHDMDAQYVVTHVVHSAVQRRSTVDGGAEGNQGYANEFTAIPAATPYRPARVTPKPRIFGIMHGRIDGPSGLGSSAPIDEFGRYKVQLPFDVSGEQGGKASRWIRMAQVSSGGGYGMHFPLHIGTEVLISHLDGDPDRPIIVGSVPNHETLSPVTSNNPSQSAIRTRTGIVVSFDDDSP